jgi:hypothetical protein
VKSKLTNPKKNDGGHTTEVAHDQCAAVGKRMAPALRCLGAVIENLRDVGPSKHFLSRGAA